MNDVAKRVELHACLRMIEASAAIARHAAENGQHEPFARELDAVDRYLTKARKLQAEVQWKR
jgi:hypothetical protein